MQGFLGEREGKLEKRKEAANAMERLKASLLMRVQYILKIMNKIINWINLKSNIRSFSNITHAYKQADIAQRKLRI